MINAGASQSLMKIDAVEIAMIPKRRRMMKEAIWVKLYQMGLLFKLNPL
jgi:hypothetical protein